jgi:hypothetical protein
MRPQAWRVILALGLLISIAGCRGNPTPPASPSPQPPPRPATAAPATSTVAGLQLEAESGDTVVHLSWQPVPGAQGYFIFRDNQSTPLNLAPIAATRFDDIGLTNGRTYRYTVAAVQAVGQLGVRSAPVEAVPASR